MNPSIEATIDKILSILEDHISEGTHDIALSMNFEDDNCIMELETKLADVPFNWRFDCHLADKVSSPPCAQHFHVQVLNSFVSNYNLSASS